MRCMTRQPLVSAIVILPFEEAYETADRSSALLALLRSSLEQRGPQRSDESDDPECSLIPAGRALVAHRAGPCGPHTP